MKKVLHIIGGFGMGGAETWLLQCARYFQQHPELGWRMDFLVTGGERAILDEEVLETGAKIFYLRYSVSSFFSFRRSFTKLITQGGYDVIHDHQDFVSGWHFLSAIGYLHSKRISHLHNPYNFVHNYVVGFNRWISFKGGRVLMRLLSTDITGTSNLVMDEYGYNKWPYKSIRIAPVYCGFNVQEFVYCKGAGGNLRFELGWGNDCKIGLFIGRIGLDHLDRAKNQKNPEFAFELAKKWVLLNDQSKFLFVGLKGVLGESMEKEVHDSDLQNRIKFLGVRKDISSIMSASDFLLFPSYWEGLGMVVVEAQANDLPVIASDTLPREAIVEADLVSLKQLIDPLDEWILLMNEVIRRSRGNNGNRQVSSSPFSIENSVNRMIKVYSEN
jgi:glycosyltransferase EpsF